MIANDAAEWRCQRSTFTAATFKGPEPAGSWSLRDDTPRHSRLQRPVSCTPATKPVILGFAAGCDRDMELVAACAYHQPTRAYVDRRTSEGESKREIMRCLKRYVAREVYTALTQPGEQKLARAA